MSIVIKHIIEESKFIINFDMQDGSISFPSQELEIEGDIDLSALIIKLSELIEKKLEIQFEFEDPSNLVEAKSKINLLKEALIDIYNSFNEQVFKETGLESDISNGNSVESTQSEDDDDLPF